MMLSALIQHRTEARHFGRLSPGSTPACADQQDWPVIAPQILSSNVRSAPSRQHAHPRFELKRSDRQAPAQLPQHSRRRQIPIAPAALSVPHTPRFPALALFGRRLSERGDGLHMPASENLHKHGSSDLFDHLVGSGN